jgi:hypothetical protein
MIAAILELCAAGKVTVMDAGLLEGVLGRLADQVLDGRI